MTTAYEIPFTAEPQTFLIALAGKQYRLTTQWNTVAEHWTLDIQDPEGEPLVMGIPIVTGTDLLKQYQYMDFGGKIFVQSRGDVTRIPKFGELGNNGLVFFVVEP